jgi:predicted alpha/beta superfamily hydrolase
MFVSFHFKMKALSRCREITVYLPDDYYTTTKSYPVLYIQDGQNAFFDINAYAGVSWGFLDYVQENHLDIIMVAIPCNFEGFKRMDEYGPWPICEELSYQETGIEGIIIGGEGQRYVEWLKDELKPYIDQRFRTIEDDCGIVGSSMGGVISAYASLAYPEVFNKCAALSTAFWFYMDEFKELIDNHDYSSLQKFYLDLGEFEGCGSEKIDQWYIESNEEILALLSEKLPSIEYHFFVGAVHNEEQWRKRVPLLMEYLYRSDNNV